MASARHGGLAAHQQWLKECEAEIAELEAENAEMATENARLREALEEMLRCFGGLYKTRMYDEAIQQARGALNVESTKEVK